MSGARDRLAEALGRYWENGAPDWAVDDLLPIMDEHAAAELEKAANDVRWVGFNGGIYIPVDALRDRADALRAATDDMSNTEGDGVRSVADSQIECDIAEVLHMRPEVTWTDALDLSAHVLALPAIVTLLDAQAAVERVRSLLTDDGLRYLRAIDVRRALDDLL